MFDIDLKVIHTEAAVLMRRHLGRTDKLAPFGLRPGQVLTVRDAINAAIVASANDAAVALAEKIAETEPAFAARMTNTAMELGMFRTFFQNASGLPADGQETTARDLEILASAFLLEFPQNYALFNQRSVTDAKRSLGTVN